MKFEEFYSLSAKGENGLCKTFSEARKLCPLHMFRMGKNPQLKRKGNPNIGKIGNNLRKGSVTSDKKTESDIKEVL